MERDSGELGTVAKTCSWWTALRDFVALDFGMNYEGERGIVSASVSEGFEALHVRPCLVHVGPVGIDGVS